MEAFVASVFSGADALGNPTGVVRTTAPLDHEAARTLASKLGLPDLVFVSPVASGHWRARFFSPSEELAVCYQALIAAAVTGDQPEQTFELRDRALQVEKRENMGWVRTPRHLVQRFGSTTTPGGLAADVIDTGRRRAYARVPLDQLESFALTPDEALSWLRSQELSGLCIVHAELPRVRLRVFTTSLNGGEDVATGGAVAGLPVFLGSDASLHVVQGRDRRGELHVDVSAGEIRVGGRCEILLRGTVDASALRPGIERA